LDDQAGQASALRSEKLDKEARKGFIGYALIDFVSTEYGLKYGTWNARPLKSSEVQKLHKSMELHGYRFRDHNNFLSLVMDRDDILIELPTDAYPEEGLPHLQVRPTGGKPLVIKAASGQHRHHAVLMKRKKIDKKIERIGKGKKKVDEDEDEDEEIELDKDEEDLLNIKGDAQKEEMKKKLLKKKDNYRYWGAGFYDISKRPHSNESGD
jgi:hypothetical protein